MKAAKELQFKTVSFESPSVDIVTICKEKETVCVQDKPNMIHHDEITLSHYGSTMIYSYQSQ